MGQGNSLWGVKMIDLLELKILFDASLVDTVDERHALIGVNFEELEIPLGAKSIHFRDDGTIGTSVLYHPWESLPTSFTGMAFKVHLDGYFSLMSLLRLHQLKYCKVITSLDLMIWL